MLNYFRLRIWGSGVRIPPSAPLRYKTGHAKTRRFRACSGDKGTQQYAFRAHDANLFRIDFNALGECAEVVAAIAAALGAHALAGLPGECFERLRRDARPEPFERILGSLCVGASLVADRLELGNTLRKSKGCGAKCTSRQVADLSLFFSNPTGPHLAAFILPSLGRRSAPRQSRTILR